MSVPSAHPNRWARHPSQSSPVCLSPQPSLNPFSFALPPRMEAVTFSPHKSLTGFKTGSSGKQQQLLKICVVQTCMAASYTRQWNKNRNSKAVGLCMVSNLLLLFLFYCRFLSFFLHQNTLTVVQLVFATFHDLASSISGLWPSLGMGFSQISCWSANIPTSTHSLYCHEWVAL